MGEVRWDTGAVLPLLYSPFGRKPDYPAAYLPALLGGEAGLPPLAGMLSPPGREHFFMRGPLFAEKTASTPDRVTPVPVVPP